MASGILMPEYYGGQTKPDLLLHFEGNSGSWVMSDSSPNNYLCNSGDTRCYISSNRAKFGTNSLYHENVSSSPGFVAYYVDNSRMAFGLADFTIDFWVYRIGTTATQILIDFRGADESNIGLRPQMNIAKSGTNYYISSYVNGSTVFTGTTNLTANTWHHVAWTRRAGTSRIFIDGVLDGSWSDTTNYGVGIRRPCFGFESNSVNSGNQLYGNIDEVRIINGRAMWISNFTPPTVAYEPQPATAMEIALTANGTSSYTDVNYREMFAAALLTGVGSKVRLTLNVKGGVAYPITSMYIGHAAASGNWYDFDGTQVPVTFGGSTSITPPNTADNHVASDWINYPFDSSKNFIIAHHRTSTGTVPYPYKGSLSTTNYKHYEYASASNESGVSVPATPTNTDTGTARLFTKIEVL